MDVAHGYSSDVVKRTAGQMRLELDRTLKILLTVILMAVVGYFAWRVIQRVLYPIELFLMGAIVAFILSPLVDRLHEEGFPRPLAILTVYIVLIAAVSLLGYLLVNPLLDQILRLKDKLPAQVSDLQHRINTLHLDKFLREHKLPTTDRLAQQASSYLSGFGNTVFDNLTTLVLTSFNFIVNIFLVLVMAFYLLLDGKRLRESLYGLVPESQIERVAFVEATINEVLGGYLRGQLVMSATIGTMAGVGTAVLGVPYSLVIGVLAGILELVPMLGPWLSSMPAVVIALFSPHPWPLILWVALYFLIIQQLESNVIGPRITGHAVGLHPLGALMALLVGIELDGILGALFAVPVAGMLYVFGMAIYYDFTGRPHPGPPVKLAGPSLLTTLSGRMGVRGTRLAQRTTTSQAAVEGLRRTVSRVVPRSLAKVEKAQGRILEELPQKAAGPLPAAPPPVVGLHDDPLAEDRRPAVEEPISTAAR